MNLVNLISQHNHRIISDLCVCNLSRFKPLAEVPMFPLCKVLLTWLKPLGLMASHSSTKVC